MKNRSRFTGSAVQRFNFFAFLRRQRGEHIARWGQAKLVRHLDGGYELRGGTPEDRHQACEWCSLVLHEVVLAI